MEAKNIPEVMMAPVELDTGDLKNLKARLRKRNDKEFQNGEIWQAILNIGYAKWRSVPKSQKWDYNDMVAWVGLECGPFAKLCILLGKYNQQALCNGHMGYWDNGYAGGRTGNPGNEIVLHKEMLILMKQIRVDRLTAGRKIYEVASRFKIETWGDSDYGETQEDVLADASVDDDYADVAQYNGSWEEDFGAVVRYIITEES